MGWKCPELLITQILADYTDEGKGRINEERINGLNAEALRRRVGE
jgi:hypothetical protein